MVSQFRRSELLVSIHRQHMSLALPPIQTFQPYAYPSKLVLVPILVEICVQQVPSTPQNATPYAHPTVERDAIAPPLPVPRKACPTGHCCFAELGNGVPCVKAASQPNVCKIGHREFHPRGVLRVPASHTLFSRVLILKMQYRHSIPWRGIGMSKSPASKNQ